MTDRGREALSLSRDEIRIGPSSMRWSGDRLMVEFDELSTPHGQRLRGTVTILPAAVTGEELPLTEDGAHVWRPFAPRARIEVRVDRPGWSWDGEGYFDANFGTRALEADFSYWSWGRYPWRDGAVCFYDALRRDGSELAVAVHFGADGSARGIDAPPKARLPRPPFLVRRETRADPGFRPHQVRSMLDAPFYNRAAIKTRIGGIETVGVAESLDLDRFRGPWLMPMLAVRVPRRARWPGWF